MSGKYLLDANIVIALFAGDLPVKKHIAKADVSRTSCIKRVILSRKTISGLPLWQWSMV